MTLRDICLLAGLVLASSLPASAQGGDAAYCHALAAKWQTYLGSSANGRHAGLDQDVAARMAIDKCNAGDYSGVPILEQKLRAAKLDLPAHD